MTLCNLTIEGGARAGMVAVDDTTNDYLKGRPRAPKAASRVFKRLPPITGAR